MSTEIIQAEYDELASIARRFQQRAELTTELRSKIQRCMQVLEQGDWEGKGSVTFFAEMNAEIYPALQRLVSALTEACSAILAIKKVLEDAEEEAASVFQQVNSSYLFQQVKGTTAATRPELSKILSDYQVQSDKMTDWRPSGFGVIPIPFTKKYKITETEAKLLDRLSRDRGLVGLDTFNDIRNQVFQVAEKHFPNSAIPAYVPDGRKREWLGNDGHRDAFRHAYWNALLTKEFGAEWTTQFTTAHEGLDSNPAVREAMDLYNNEVGRQIAISNPNATEEQLANLVKQAVDNGEMVVVDQSGNLAWSNQVPLGSHGLVDNTPGKGGKPLPVGDASAR